jgi:uncharacterized protein (DUF736 family)
LKSCTGLRQLPQRRRGQFWTPIGGQYCAPIDIEKNAEKAGDGQPDYRIFAGEAATEIGGGWVRKAKGSGRDYISITLADPQIGPRKIYANLSPVKGRKGRHVILWNPKD